MTIIFNKKSADYVDDGLALKARTTFFCLLTNPISQESLNPRLRRQLFCTEKNLVLIPVQGIGKGMLNWLQEVQQVRLAALFTAAWLRSSSSFEESNIT